MALAVCGIFMEIGLVYLAEGMNRSVYRSMIAIYICVYDTHICVARVCAYNNCCNN